MIHMTWETNIYFILDTGGGELCPGKILSGRNSAGKNSVPILILPGKNSVPSSWDGENIKTGAKRRKFLKGFLPIIGTFV
jgi:hypothetical protein